MTVTRVAIARTALDKAIEVREEAGYDDRVPVCIYEVCRKLGVEVRFVDVNMEGMYVNAEQPQVLLSALRPLPRRAFTCAHELGHHAFGHGSTIDELKEEAQAQFNPDEFLVDSFAGHLLMPKIAVRKGFVLRGLKPETAGPEDVYRVACSLGVGYETLCTQMGLGLRLISDDRSQELQKVGLPKIRKGLLGQATSSPLVVLDAFHQMPTADIEVGSQLLLPKSASLDADSLELVEGLANGNLYVAKRPGIVRVEDSTSKWAAMVRVSRFQYVGLCEYRHLEEEEGDVED